MKEKTMSIHDILDVPKEYHSISRPKLNISKAIKEEIEKKGLSVRGLAENVGMKHPQIVRVTSGENYNIETLLKVLDGLDLELVVQPKSKK